MDGVTHQIDLTQPSKYDKDRNLVNADASRIVDLKYKGEPIDPAQTFVVATNNDCAGGGNFPDINDDVVIFVAPDTNRDVIVRTIVDQGTINPSADANWVFKPIDGATAVFETGPKAKAPRALRSIGLRCRRLNCRKKRPLPGDGGLKQAAR